MNIILVLVKSKGSHAIHEHALIVQQFLKFDIQFAVCWNSSDINKDILKTNREYKTTFRIGSHGKHVQHFTYSYMSRVQL